MKITKYKVGDMVEILSKSSGVPLNYTYNNGKRWKSGDTGTIHTVFSNSYKLEGSDGTFKHKDLRLITKLEFKLGDKVKILGKANGYNLADIDWKIGDIGYIGEIGKGNLRNKTEKGYWLRKTKDGMNQTGIFFTEDLELVEDVEDVEKVKYVRELKSRFKTGDRVKVLSKTSKRYKHFCCGVTVGYIGNIEAIHSDHGEILHLVGGNYFLEVDLAPTEYKPKEVIMKYIGMQSLYVKDLISQAKLAINITNPSSDENSRFITKMIKEFGYNYGQMIRMDTQFFDYIEKHSCFVVWLERNGFIKSKPTFKPFDIVLRINSNDEYWTLWHRLNCNDADVSNYEEYANDSKKYFRENSSTQLWEKVNTYKNKVNTYKNKDTTLSSCST